ncbi:hypothetical protein G6F55_014707 [Rhizopus delemar]|nr:hypothetical protein G6F55_014707 [Rhizopus delemar]
MPTAWRVSSVSRANSVVMITALGTPSRSSAMESRTQAEQHEPQSPMAVSTTSFSAAMRSISSGAASLEKLCLT